MTLKKNAAEKNFQEFSKLNRAERLARLVAMGALTPEDVQYLNLSVDRNMTELAEKFIENVIGCFPLPLGVAAHFMIDGQDYAIPMAVEETSIIAAASRTAKWIRESGKITTETLGKTMIGQIQVARVRNFQRFKTLIEDEQKTLVTLVNQTVAPNFVARGGGVEALNVREIRRPDGGQMAVVHVLFNPCDAMGANVISQICEFLKTPIQNLTQEKVTMCIISNLADKKLTRATVTIDNIDPEVGEAIAEASLFAEHDPYRAATHNKGVLNGIDPVLLATGNDWRAVEAGMHAYAARSGQYRSLTRWSIQGRNLIGTLEAPICVGIVGGVTSLHPTAQLSLRMLQVNNADHLARIVAAVGLVQNLGALRALTSEGIVRGHMKLHVNNLILAAGALPAEVPPLKQQLEEFLKANAKITLGDAKNFLKILREKRDI